MEVFSNESKCTVKISGSDIYDQAEIHFDMVVPADLDERAEGKVSVTMLVDMTVALRKDSKVIDFNVKVDNKGLSHRLCVLFDSQIVSAFNYADQQFGLIKRPNYYEKEMKLYMESMNNKTEKKAGIRNLQTGQMTSLHGRNHQSALNQHSLMYHLPMAKQVSQ